MLDGTPQSGAVCTRFYFLLHWFQPASDTLWVAGDSCTELIHVAGSRNLRGSPSEEDPLPVASQAGAPPAEELS